MSSTLDELVQQQKDAQDIQEGDQQEIFTKKVGLILLKTLTIPKRYDFKSGAWIPAVTPPDAFLSDLVEIVIHECIKCEGTRVKVNNDHTPMYPTVKFEDVESEHVDTWEAAEDCTCTFPKLANKSEGANTIRDYRDELTRWIACNVKSILSKPPKRANPNHVPKESLTRKQLREKWGDARDKRKEELKKRKRKGKGKKKSTKVKENTNKKKVIDTNPRKKMIFDDQDDV